tara:strand:+ start:95 stop:484 length:390 start_codon:yes stop_codon:yes gene_type:complete
MNKLNYIENYIINGGVVLDSCSQYSSFKNTFSSKICLLKHNYINETINSSKNSSKNNYQNLQQSFRPIHLLPPLSPILKIPLIKPLVLNTPIHEQTLKKLRIPINEKVLQELRAPKNKKKIHYMLKRLL